MPVIDHAALQDFSERIFRASGIPDDQAGMLSAHLVESNLMGHDSHGVIRIPAYIEQIEKGSFKPCGDFAIVRESPAACVIDAGGCIGIVMAYRAMEMAVDRARKHTFGAVAVHNCGHIGRLGAFPPIACANDCIGVIMLNGGSCFTAPFGGTGRRLPPNPLAIGVPTDTDSPMVLDITTSMAAGGKVRLAKAKGKTVPEDWLIDEQGRVVVDPGIFLEERAAMLPLGGTMGHKGFGLAVMIDAIAGGLSWAGCSTEKPTRGGKGFFAMAIDIESFIDVGEFRREIRAMGEWIKTSPRTPGVDRIYLPGEIEEANRAERGKTGVSVEEATWSALKDTAARLGVSPPEVTAN
jgi:uncharacterized oxidoreductase